MSHRQQNVRGFGQFNKLLVSFLVRKALLLKYFYRRMVDFNLLRQNVFIAECKFWKGPKAFSEAIDQLLGYATWRDTKTAILVFNRGTDTSTVINGVNTTSTKHSNFKRTIDWPHESGFRYMFHANGDVNRELILTVLVFHVPG